MFCNVSSLIGSLRGASFGIDDTDGSLVSWRRACDSYVIPFSGLRTRKGWLGRRKVATTPRCSSVSIRAIGGHPASGILIKLSESIVNAVTDASGRLHHRDRSSRGQARTSLRSPCTALPTSQWLSTAGEVLQR